jgi:hypothetical protein
MDGRLSVDNRVGVDRFGIRGGHHSVRSQGSQVSRDGELSVVNRVSVGSRDSRDRRDGELSVRSPGRSGASTSSGACSTCGCWSRR